MSALEAYIRDRLRHKPLLLMTHVIVGYPSLEVNMRMLEMMQRADVDLVELQMPFSEPIADGPVFVRANQQALDAGMTREQYFVFMQRAVANFDFKILLMGYYNSVFQVGHEAFCACLAEHGSSGFILADLPLEESDDLYRHANAYHLDPILLMTPTTPVPRLQRIARAAKGFIYCVARKGVTGSQTDFDHSLVAFVERCRQATPLPLALGFGLQSGEDLRRIRGLVDIATVGTSLLTAWEQGGAASYESLLCDLHDATVAPRP